MLTRKRLLGSAHGARLNAPHSTARGVPFSINQHVRDASMSELTDITDIT